MPPFVNSHDKPEKLDKGAVLAPQHDWRETEVGCEDCGTHPAVQCEHCDETVDLVMNDDPARGGIVRWR